MPKEPGMGIAYDQVSKKVTIIFRGKKVILPGRYKTREEGIRAGEQFCRGQGWKG